MCRKRPVLRVDEFHGRGSTPLLVDYLRFAKEIDAKLVLTFKSLTQLYEVREERFVSCFQIEYAFIGQHIGHFAFVNEHCSLARSNDELARIDDFVVPGRVLIPDDLRVVVVPLNDSRQLIVK